MDSTSSSSSSTTTTSTTTATKEWGESLVGRDWEIYWSEAKEVGTQVESSASHENAMETDDGEEGLKPKTNKVDDNNNNNKRDDENDNDDDEDDDDEGSIIDDWYAGKVLSMNVTRNGQMTFRILFVGDDQVYTMELGPSKVRPSARGWIKRTSALLCGPKMVQKSKASSSSSSPLTLWHANLPRDTATIEDALHIQKQKEQLLARHYEPIGRFPEVKDTVEIPTMSELQDVMMLHHLLDAQIYLRTKLGTIVNLHGSIKYIDGEPNPTQPFVNHLVDCCGDLHRTCAWYLKCWELLSSCFAQRSGQSSNERSESKEKSITYDSILSHYLEYGKDCLLNCASMNIESSTNKRRHVSSPSSTASSTSPSRRPKRRRKQSKYLSNNESPEDAVVVVADEGDLRSTATVERFVQKLNESTSSWYFMVFGKMMKCISSYIVDPLVRWKLQAKEILGTKDDLVDVLVEDEKRKAEDTESKISREAPSDIEIMSVESDDSDNRQTFTYEGIEACLKALEENPVLSFFLDTFEEEQALKQKLTDIESAASQIESLLRRIAEGSSGVSSSTQGENREAEDDVLEGLRTLLNTLESQNRSLFNVDPIGKAGMSWTRDQIENAITLREWLLDVRHASMHRERREFIERIVESAKTLQELSVTLALPDSESLSRIRKEVESQVREMELNLGGLDEVEARFNSRASLEASDKASAKEGAMRDLDELAVFPILLLTEEKIAMLVDTIEWSELASSVLDNVGSRLGFTQLEKLYNSYQLVVNGQSKLRTKVVGQAKASDRIESKIRQFVVECIHEYCGAQSQQVCDLYASSSQWKEKAEAIISTLRMHGNIAVGEARRTLKPVAMVDIKRISDLLLEYEGLEIEIPGYTALLQKVFDDAVAWSSQLEQSFVNDSLSFNECLEILATEKESRPKGLIMNPTRQVIDTIIELLEWHQRTRQSLITLLKSLQNAAVEDHSSVLSDYLVSTAYALLVEGIPVVQVFTSKNESHFSPITESTVRSFEENTGIRPPCRALQLDKIEVHNLGTMLLQRMTSVDVDAQEGFPLSMLCLVDWHLQVSAMVSSGSLDDDTAPQQPSRQAISLSKALDLCARRPKFSGDENNLEATLWSTDTSELVTLNQRIREAEQLETEIRQLVGMQKDLRKGALDKAETVRQHLNRLKELFSTFKERALGQGGLSLCPTLESQLEQQIKIFSWMVRTFSYPFLYLDEASYSSPTSGEGDEKARIPWDVLVTLYERMPSDNDTRADDFALVTMRVRDLYEAAKIWQDEITRSTLLSNRGGKRRAPGVSPNKIEAESETSSRLQMEKMKQLAENPVLSKVIMPREGAVNGILQNSTEFELRLHSILDMDFVGENPDRAAYPDDDSLVGKNGEFVLFRLTGSELFQTMLGYVNELSVIAENVLAETPGKTTFDWIKRAVGWIEELRDSVTQDTPFRDARKKVLIIPVRDARRLVLEGEKIFLVIPDELKRTLSQHGIFVSTNKQGRSLRVVLKKDGAHHSLGGTVIRWCPILFECLKADISRLDDWEKGLTMILGQFNIFFAETRSNPKTDENDLYRWYCFHERVSTLLEEGQQTLVVSPQLSLVNSFTNLLSSLQNYLVKHSSPTLNKKFAKKLFNEGTSLLDDRFELLDALLSRRALSGDQKGAVGSSQEETTTAFREICRTYLITSLGKALKSIGMQKAKDIVNVKNLEAFCSIKAWEIENEMYDRFQGENGTSRISEDYKNKARSLRVSMDDKHNISLCLRVLIGEISASQLVSMTKEELASQKTKLDRARAEKEALHSTNLTPTISSTAKKTNDEPIEVMDTEVPTEKTASKAASKFGTGSILRPATIHATVEASKATTLEPDNENGRDASEVSDSPIDDNSKRADSENESAGVSNTTEEPSPDFADLSAATLKLLATKTSAKTARPPPPPSLVNSFQPTSQPEATSDVNDRRFRVINEDGGDRFRIEIVNLRLSFNAAFYLESDERQDGVHRFLPASLIEKGRLPDKEFTRFVASKVSGGRWVAIPLRLTTLSDQDSKDYKKYYQEYELKNRIAMFTVNQETKVFLITPKFHSAAKNTVSLANKTSTYAVILTKDLRILVD